MGFCGYKTTDSYQFESDWKSIALQHMESEREEKSNVLSRAQIVGKKKRNICVE